MLPANNCLFSEHQGLHFSVRVHPSSATLPFSAGFYCPNTSSSLQCPPGYFCKLQSTSPRKCPPLTHCPPGTIAPQLSYMALVVVAIVVSPSPGDLSPPSIAREQHRFTQHHHQTAQRSAPTVWFPSSTLVYTLFRYKLLSSHLQQHHNLHHTNIMLTGYSSHLHHMNIMRTSHLHRTFADPLHGLHHRYWEERRLPRVLTLRLIQSTLWRLRFRVLASFALSVFCALTCPALCCGYCPSALLPSQICIIILLHLAFTHLDSSVIMGEDDDSDQRALHGAAVASRMTFRLLSKCPVIFLFVTPLSYPLKREIIK